MKRVLNVIGKRPCGGIGSFVINYQSNFQPNIIKIDYLIFDDELQGDFDKKVSKLGSTVYVLPALKNRRLFSIWREIEKFFKVHAEEYVAVHLHSVNIAFMILTAARKNGIKNLLAHSHATMYSDKKLNGIRNYFLCLNLNKQATMYLACSRAAGQFLFGKNNSSEIVILNNAIDCDKFKFSKLIRQEIREDLNLQEKYVVGHVGRFNEQKNHKFLINIFEEIYKINNKAVLLLIGDGPLVPEIDRMIKEKHLESSIMKLGMRNDVAKLLQGMDVFVLPSLYEGLPVIGIEAQASGLPCVMSDKVTTEVSIINVKFMSLKQDAYQWAVCINYMKNSIRREDAAKIVSDAGYNIKIEALKLQKIYQSF